jgi:hypothetical protein
MNDEKSKPTEPLSIDDIDIDGEIVCPKCGQTERFKEHQTVGSTQHLDRTEDGSYEYGGTENDEVIEAEEIACAVCNATVAVNNDTLADRLNRHAAEAEAMSKHRLEAERRATAALVYLAGKVSTNDKGSAEWIREAIYSADKVLGQLLEAARLHGIEGELLTETTEPATVFDVDILNRVIEENDKLRALVKSKEHDCKVLEERYNRVLGVTNVNGIRQAASIRHAVDVLNRALLADHDAVLELVNARVPCNLSLAKDPTIQVAADGDAGPYRVGLLGIVNGIFGIDGDGWGPITAQFDDSGKLEEFFDNGRR